MLAGNRKAWLAGATALAMLGLGADAGAQDRVEWRLQSVVPNNLPHAGTSGVRLVDAVEVMSDGSFVIKLFEPGALVPPLECFDAASKGSVDACWTVAAFHAGKHPALAFFTAVPFGPQYGEFFAWKRHGGGNQLQDEIYAQHDLKGIDCNAVGPETSGWFREPVESLEDLRGLKMRFLGLGAKVMAKLGVSTQLLAIPDIYPALERGVIDATEYSMPDQDISLGFHKIAKYNYYPGWHQQVTIGELLMHRPAWHALSKAHQKILEVACGWNTHVNYAETEAANPHALNEMKDRYGVTVERWTDEQLAAFEAAWREVIEEESANDPEFKKVADSYLAFREEYKTWGDAQRLSPTYLDH